MTPTETWHGLTNREWLECWAPTRWKESTSAVLQQIACSADVPSAERLLALATLNQYLQVGILDPSHLVSPFPIMSRDVLIAIAFGDKRGWWRRWRTRHIEKRCANQLLAVRYLLNMASEFAIEGKISVVDATSLAGLDLKSSLMS